MRRSRLLLILTGTAFLAWIGYLVYQTMQFERPPIILSRPQFLAVKGVIIGRVTDKDEPVTVDEVVLAPPQVNLKVGAKLRVDNLSGSLHNWTSARPDAEWDMPGEFIIPLHGFHFDPKGDMWEAVVVGLPPSPGLPVGTRVYPKTEATMEQLRSILGQK
jgi:hypothetical protein